MCVWFHKYLDTEWGSISGWAAVENISAWRRKTDEGKNSTFWMDLFVSKAVFNVLAVYVLDTASHQTRVVCLKAEQRSQRFL